MTKLHFIDKLDSEQIKEIRKKYKKGVSIVSLAKEYKVDRKTIYYHIARGGIKLKGRIPSKKNKPRKKVIYKKPKVAYKYKEYLEKAREREKKKYGFVSW